MITARPGSRPAPRDRSPGWNLGSGRPAGTRPFLASWNSGDHRKRRPGVVPGFAHAADARHLVEVAIEGQHFSVETIEGAETEGAVSLQLANGGHAAIDTFHQGGRCGDLKQRRLVDLQSVSQGGHDDVRYWLTGLPAA